VPELQLHKPVHRNLLAPVLIAFVVLGIAIALVIRYTPHRVADLEITRTSIYPSHLVFKSDSLVVGADRTEDQLYILLNLRVTDRLNLPLFLKDFTATLTTAEGEKVETSAAEKTDMPALYTAFPALKPMASAPLLRETLIRPGDSAEGMVLVHFPVNLDTWNRRRFARLHINFYHQGPLSITIPNNNGTSSSQNDRDPNAEE
jgi:hypothetical protein